MGACHFTHSIQIMSCCIAGQQARFLNPTGKDHSNPGMYILTFVNGFLANCDSWSGVSTSLLTKDWTWEIPSTSSSEFVFPVLNLPGL